MKPYTEPQGLQSWLQRLKEYLEELPSKLVHSEPRYEKLGPRCEDTEHRIENASPSIDVVTPYFPAFAPRMRLSRSAFRKLLAFGMVTLFMIPWLMFLWRGGSWFANKRSGSDDPVLNATLGVGLPAIHLYWRILADTRTSSKKCLRWPCRIAWTEFRRCWMPPVLLILILRFWMQSETLRSPRRTGPRDGRRVPARGSGNLVASRLMSEPGRSKSQCPDQSL